MSIPYPHCLRHFSAVVRMLALLGVVWASLSAGMALAQTGEPVQTSFRVYLWPETVDVSSYVGDGNEEGYFYKPPQIAYLKSADAEPESIEISDGRLSKVYHYTGEGPLVFFKEEQGPEGQVLRVPLASVSADNLSDDTVLIFFPTSGNAEFAYHILPIPAPTKRIPDGQVMVYNLTRQKLALYTGKKVQVLGPSEIILSELGRAEDASVPLRILVEDNGDWTLRHTELQIIGDNEKLLFFIFPRDAESNRFRVLSINTAI